jgi:hypothetical protein
VIDLTRQTKNLPLFEMAEDDELVLACTVIIAAAARLSVR